MKERLLWKEPQVLPEILGRWAVNLVQLRAEKKRRCHVPPLFSERVEEELDPPRWPLRKEDKCSQERMKKRWGKGKWGTSGCCQVPHPRGFWRGPSRPSSPDTACPALARPGKNRSGRGSPSGDEPGSRGKRNGGSMRRRGHRGLISSGGMERWHSLCILHAFFRTISSTS